jgi:hypothetical protein
MNPSAPDPSKWPQIVSFAPNGAYFGNEWVAGQFDPKRFDLDTANLVLGKI